MMACLYFEIGVDEGTSYPAEDMYDPQVFSFGVVQLLPVEPPEEDDDDEDEEDGDGDDEDEDEED